MEDNADYTPEEVVTELVPADLTPDAVILGQQPEVDIIWTADVIVDRGPIDGLTAEFVTGWCVITDAEFGYNDMDLEQSAMVWAADQLRVDPADVTVVSFGWSALIY